MSVKYRIRLSNERVIGPFSEEEIVELVQKDHILGTENCQLFPIGDWKPISSFQSIYSVIQPIIEEKARLIKEQQELEAKKNAPPEPKKEIKVQGDHTASGIKVYQEFKFQQGAKVEVDYKELEKKHRKPDEEDDDGMEKTVIISRNKPKSKPNVDKTVVIKKQADDESRTFVVPDKSVEQLLKEAKEKEEADESKEEEKQVVVKLEPQEVDPRSAKELANEQTQFIDLGEVLPNINAQLKASEIEFEKLAKIQESEEKHREKIEREKKLREAIEAARAANEETELVVDNKGHPASIKKKNKGMSWIVALAFIAIIYVLLDGDEPEKKSGPTYFKVSFPVTKEFENQEEAKKELAIGKNIYKENTYIKRVIASKHFLNSIEFQFDGNPALGEYALVSAELFENSTNEKMSANTIYKILKISDKNLLKDANTANAAALFYGKIGKPYTGIKIVKNFLRLGSKPTIKLLAAYLDNLILAGEFVEAKKAYDKVKDIPQKPFEVYISLSRYLESDEKIAEAQEIIEEGLKYYPKNAALLLRLANFTLKSQSLEKFEETLIKLKAIEVEGSPVYLAEYFKYMGMLSALKGKTKDATFYFKKSLELRESDELRMRLAELEISGTQMSQNLILESKIIALLKRAREEIKNRNWDQAVSLTAEAITANPNYVPAAIVQAELQLHRGLFEAAIHTLSNVKDSNPNNFQLQALLIETYLKAYKYDDAQKLLVEGSQSKFAKTTDYYYLYGLFFEGKNNFVLAVKYYEEALRINPLNDKIMYKLAQIFFRIKKFPDAKKQLNEAMILDPRNTNYQSLYAQIIQEQDNADTAIGYLRDLISEYGEDPKLLSTITALYFKSGQLNEFKAYYKKVQDLPKKDEQFYEYLISAAKLDESLEEFEQYSKELIKINPGNLVVRMNLADHYIEKAKYAEAIFELNEIKEKLPSYPKVNYMLAKVYLAQGDMNAAKKMAELELKQNPNLDSAFFIMGEVYRQNKEYREAVAYLEKAISKNGKNVDALMALGWIRLNQNLASEALDLYMNAAKYEPGNPDVHRQLGFTYKSLGQRALAKEKFDDYLKLSPGAPDRGQIEQLLKTLK